MTTLTMALTRNAERVYFLLLAASMLISVFAGFAPGYYLRGLDPSPKAMHPPTALVHLHAGVFSAWILLFIIQVNLVAAGRRGLHRRLGMLGLGLVVAMIAIGIATALAQVARRSGPPMEPLSWLAMPLFSVAGFGVCFLTALALRHRPDAHKRLMVLGMVAMLSSAFGRMTFLHPMLALLVLPNLYTVALITFDLAALRRLHPATLWGGGLVLVTTVSPIFLWRTPAWLVFAGWITGA